MSKSFGRFLALRLSLSSAARAQLVTVSTILFAVLAGCIKPNAAPPKSRALNKSAEKILIVSAEQTGVFNTGGLGHTVESLAKALENGGMDTDVLMPFYSDIEPAIRNKTRKALQSFEVTLNEVPGRQSRTSYKFDLYYYDNLQTGVRTWLLKHEGTTEQSGLFSNLRPQNEAKRYTNQNEGEAFLAFNKAAAQFIDGHDHSIINIHDWHSGFVRNAVTDRKKRFLFTISNIGYQGLFDGGLSQRAGMSPEEFWKTTEFYGKFNFMKHGITTSDMVLTVAPNYLREIATERFGGGLHGLVNKLAREFRISAILNGTDTESWNPVRQFHKDIVHTFSSDNLTGKSKGKARLQTTLGLNVSAATPLICLTSRLADQKGYAYLIGSLDAVATKRNVQFVILGDGEPRYVAQVKALAEKHPRKVVFRSFDADLEKPLTAYSDFFINTPWYEPSGTNQLFAMKNGTIPIVSRVGGLADFVKDRESGFLVDIAVKADGVQTDLEKTQFNISSVINSAIDAFANDPAFINRMRTAAMKQDNSWDSRIDLYRKLFAFIRANGSLALQKAHPNSSSLEMTLEAMFTQHNSSRR
jgi:starch synthase